MSRHRSRATSSLRVLAAVGVLAFLGWATLVALAYDVPGGRLGSVCVIVHQATGRACGGATVLDAGLVWPGRIVLLAYAGVTYAYWRSGGLLRSPVVGDSD